MTYYRICNKSNTTVITSGAETGRPSGVHGSPLIFSIARSLVYCIDHNNFYFVKTSFSFQILQLFPILENNITCYRICSHLLVFTVYLNVGYTQ